MEKVIIKCRKCGCESLGDSRFCSFCGNELQPEKLRTLEEIKAMQQKIPELARVRNIQDVLRSLAVSLTVHLTLGWVLGTVTDEKLFKLLKGD